MDYKITGKENVLFNNNTFYCVGTGRMGLALQKHYQEQLKFVQEKLGFEHIRGHGLFCDDLSIYHEYEENGIIKSEYNWTYLDMVMDSYKELKIRPFLELGFMPKKIASGEQCVFYWRGNVTPPADYKKWTELVQATLCHLMDRYGADEVVTWPVEVWNEPNLTVFWKDADMKEYFNLYDKTSRAVKKVDERFKIGGPAVCGGTDEVWIKAFLEFVREKKCPLDFVSRHHYTTEFPAYQGHYGYPELYAKERCFEQLVSTRPLVDSFKEFKNIPIHITEYNTSYIPTAPVHDMNLNAAYIANMLASFGDNHESYSYWTFGDIFEEAGVPYTPFHGGFGLVANGLIPKPTFWTFYFYKKLTEGYIKCVLKTPECIVVQCAQDCYKGIAWNIDEKLSGKEMDLHFTLPLSQEKESNVLFMQLVDEEVCNPLKVWHDLGEHSNPTKEEISVLRRAAQPLIKTCRTENQFNLHLKQNAVCYFEIKNQVIKSDRGYEYLRLK